MGAGGGGREWLWLALSLNIYLISSRRWPRSQSCVEQIFDPKKRAILNDIVPLPSVKTESNSFGPLVSNAIVVSVKV